MRVNQKSLKNRRNIGTNMPVKKGTSRALMHLVLLFLLTPVSLFALDFKVRVFDPGSKKALPDVQVILIETKTKYYTDAKGEVNAQVPAPGFYTFRAIVPGGAILQPRLQVNSPGQLLTIFTREPEPGSSPLEETSQVVGEGGLTVTGKKEKQSLSRYEVRIDEVKRIPGQFGDALRGIETLPGVAPLPFAGPSTIVLRGANPDASTFLLDDLPMGYAFHFFANQVLHNDIISSIDVYTGAYPADYGNATGGVIHIHTIDHVDEDFAGNTSYSLWSTATMFKGKLGDGDGYWYGAGRVSYLHKTFSGFVSDGVQLPYYWDGQFKAHYQLDPENAIEFYAFGAKDTYAVELKDKGSWDPTSEPDPVYVGASLAVDQAFHTEALRHTWNPTSKISNQLSLINHDNILYFNGSVGIYDAVISAHSGWVGLKDEFDWEVIEDHIYVDAGFEAKQIIFSQDGQTIHALKDNIEYPDYYDSVDPDFETLPFEDKGTLAYNNAYTMVTLRGGGFEFKPGFRVEQFSASNQTTVDPRGTLSYTLEETGTTVMAGGGVYHKVPYPWYFSETSGNPNLKMEKAEHYAVGVEQKWKNWLFKLEGFRQYYSDIVVTDAYVTTPYRLKTIMKVENIRRQQHIDDIIADLENPIEENARLGYSNDGTGSSEGIELMIKYSLPPEKNGIYGWVTYTWSRSLRNNHQHVISDAEANLILSADERRILYQYDNTKDIYADFDRTVMANLVLGYKMNRDWQFGAKWAYQTATPYTPVIGNEDGYRISNGRVIFNPEYSDLTNSERLKPYHRLDIRVDHFIHYEWGYANVFFEALNVYMRKNTDQLSYSTGRPFSETNPTESYDIIGAGLRIPVSDNSVLKAPLFNIGLELKF